MNTRARLSEQAARLFASRGYHGTSVSDLASALGIQKASVYAHIKGKDDLLAELTLTGSQSFHDALDAIPEGSAPIERLRLALAAHLGVVARQMDLATVWLREWRYLDGEARELYLRERRRYERRVSRLFDDAVATGDLRDDLDVRYATLAFMSLGNWSHTWMHRRTRVDQVADAFWDLLLHGAGTPTS